MSIDRDALASFLRARRDALQPEDVGLARGPRRRTDGLRREEVAALAYMSPDYYARLERATGPQPSPQMVAAIAQGLRLTLDERTHLFHLAGHPAPSAGGGGDHVGPGMLRILDRLADTPAEVISELGETLCQTPVGVALFGDARARTGMERSVAYRWFTDPATRARYPAEDHDHLSRMWASGLREIAGARGPGSRAAMVVDDLKERSADFRALWARGEVGVRPHDTKRFVHPEVGVLELSCQTLSDPDRSQMLLVYTAEPGSESAEKLALLAVIGSQSLH